eukprot:Skav233954  [mRNA]  locus=scaffold1382:228157:229780:+ [translate_table: standard]
MPQIDGPLNLTWGRGMLLLSQLPEKKQRLHFIMQEGMKKFEGAEACSEEINKTMLGSHGFFSSSTTYKATHGLRYLTIPLDVETQIFGCSAEMADVATLVSRFEGGNEKSSDCCNCFDCQCKCKCSCRDLCIGMPRCCGSTQQDSAWQGALEDRPPFTKGLSKEIKETEDSTFKFNGRELKGQESREIRVDQMHTIKIMYQLPSQKPTICTAWLEPTEDLKTCLKFVHTLRVNPENPVKEEPSSMQLLSLPLWLSAFRARFVFNASDGFVGAEVSKRKSCCTRRAKIILLVVSVLLTAILIAVVCSVSSSSSYSSTYDDDYGYSDSRRRRTSYSYYSYDSRRRRSYGYN